MEFQFIIPINKSELLHTAGNNYCVRLVELKNISDKLQDAKRSICQDGHLAIFDHFDIFFSIMEHYKNIQKLTKTRSYDLLYLAIDKLGTYLATLLRSNDIPQEDRAAALNATKMLVYAIIGIVKVIDLSVLEANDGVVKRGKKNMETDEWEDWDEHRFKSLVQLYNLIQLPLERLWDPPVPEESFINLLGDLAYRTLEHKSIRQNKVATTVFQILGTMIKRYNHAITFPVRILQVLKTCELSVSPIANGVVLLFEEFNLQTIFTVLVKEMIEILSMDAADTQTARFFGAFLVEIGHAAPKLLIPHLSMIGDELLNSESHVLRNSVFQVIGDVILAELTAEELTDELKEARDEFLEDLLGHLMDVSAHCRSKVLQVWLYLKVNNAVPLSYQYKVLQETVGRLEDKTSMVRKNAITLFKAFLEHNPFSGKLSFEELQAKYEQENEKLQELRNKMLEQEKKLQEIDGQWDAISEQLLPIVVKMVTEGDWRSPKEQPGGDMVSRVATLIKEEKFYDVVLLVKSADSSVANSELDLLNENEKCGFYIALLRSYYLLASEIVDYNDEFNQQENTVNFLRDSSDFAQLISNAIPKLQELLMSKTNTDVFETIDLFTTAHMFGIRGTEAGMRQMLYLVWSPDKEKRDSVVEAYKKVLFTTDIKDPQAHALKVVQNLSGFIEILTTGQFSALEALVIEWTKEGEINDLMIQAMFKIYAKKYEGITENQARLALQLLTLCAVAKPSIVSANQTMLESYGFDNNGISDPRIFTGTLQIYMNSIAKDTENASKYYRRYDPFETTMVQNIVTTYEKFFFSQNIVDFDEITSKTFDFIYRMCLTPDIQAHTIILSIYNRLQTISEEMKTRVSENDRQSQASVECMNVGRESQVLSQMSQSTQAPTQSGNPLTLPDYLLTRFIYLIGYIALKEMIYLDIDVYSNLKYRQDLKEEKKNARKTAAHNISRASAANTTNIRKTASMENQFSASSATKKRLSGQQEQDQDEQMVGATAEDSIAEQINFICENEMLYSRDTMFYKFVPMIREICKNPGRFKDDRLQQTATLSLIRLMAVSSKFCEDNMPFLMNIFTHTKNVSIKCNIVIGLSDFTFRFPNVIEPWTGHLYATLHEENTELRLTSVKMLSHLILHEMIRVKGQISELAMCIVDEDESIRTITQQFFKEIANKSNILYNVLPDIISRLSDPSANLEEDKYRVIMKFIMGLIQKDRQVESLVEKLCLRFRVTNLERQWRDIAYCLSLLSYTEKTIKKLIDLIGCFKDKVQIEEVYNAFKLIISNTSKLAKPELKAACVELYTRLVECLAVNDSEVGSTAGTSTADTNTVFKRPKAPATKSKGKKTTVPKGPVRRTTRTPSGSQRRKLVVTDTSESSSSSEEEREVENVQPPQQPSSPSTRSSSRNKTITMVVETDTSTDESESRPKAKRGRTRRN